MIIVPGVGPLPGHDLLEHAGALLLVTLNDRLPVYQYVVAERRLHAPACG